MKKTNLFFMLLLVLAFNTGFGSCASSIKNVKISDHKLLVPSAEDGLRPGEDYPVTFVVLNKSTGKWIDNPDWKEIRMVSLDQTLHVRENHLMPPPFQFSKIQDPWYRAVLSIPGNPFPPVEITYPVSFRAGSLFLFTGEDGRDGTNAGMSGGHGRHASTVKIEAALYDVTGTPLEGQGSFMVIFAPGQRRWMLVKVPENGTIRVSNRGGNGGDGADGEDATGDNKRDDERGGNGYSGGNGGDGGDLILIFPEPQKELSRFFHIDVRGGKGGSGGEGGSGNRVVKKKPSLFDVLSLLGSLDGDSGYDGEPGREGRGEIQTKPMSQLFLTLDDPDFDRNRLR